MQKLLNDMWDVLIGLGDWWIIWAAGPDGTLFDLLSILKIIGSGTALIMPLCKLMKNAIEWQ